MDRTNDFLGGRIDGFNEGTMTGDKLVVNKEIGVDYKGRSVLNKMDAFTFYVASPLFTFEFLASGETNGLDILRSHFKRKYG